MSNLIKALATTKVGQFVRDLYQIKMVIVGMLIFAFAVACIGNGLKDADQYWEIDLSQYEKVEEMSNEHTAKYVNECLTDGKISLAEYRALRKLYFKTTLTKERR